MNAAIVTVLRLAIFSKRARKLFSEAEIEALAAFLAALPGLHPGHCSTFWAAGDAPRIADCNPASSARHQRDADRDDDRRHALLRQFAAGQILAAEARKENA